jgi:hypothetical protein
MPTDSPAPVIPVRDISGSAPPKPPRAVTPRIQRAIWNEPRVRRWWLLAIAIFVLFTAFSIDRVMARNAEIALIQHGLVVKATLAGADNRNTGQAVNSSDTVHLLLNFPGAAPEQVTGSLTYASMVGKTLTLRVDPADHNHWTDRTDPPPLLDSLFVGLLVSPLVPLLLVMSWLSMRAMRTVWQTGSAVPAVVSERHQSPIAPMSYAARCSLQNHRDQKIFTVYIPRIGYGLATGDLIWVIVPVRTGPPLAALWIGETDQGSSGAGTGSVPA